MKRRTVSLVCLAAVVLAAGRLAAGAENPGRRLKTVVGVLPIAYFVERVAGTAAEVVVLVGPGQDPHTYEPTPKQAAALSEADLCFSIGLPFERRMIEKVAAMNRRLKTVDITAGIPFRAMTEEAEEEGHEGHAGHDAGHRHDAGHHHAAGERDPHVWLNPRYAKILAANICKSLKGADPARAVVYEKNLAALAADLDRLDAKLARALAPLKGKEFLVFHPAFGYFAEAYGLREAAVEIEGKEPSARELVALIDKAKRKGIRMIFVQPQFSDRSARAVADAISGVVVPMDDLSRDYMKNLEDIAEKVRRALGPAGKNETDFSPRKHESTK